MKQKVILSVLLVIIIGLIGVLGYQMQKNEKKQTDGNASASSSVSSSSLAGDSSEPISDSSPEEEITPTPEPVQQISSDGLNSQHALLVRESDLAEMMNLGGDERIYPASMTKIMTALLTIENLPIRRLLSPMSHRHLRRMAAAHHREDHEPSAVRTD